MLSFTRLDTARTFRGLSTEEACTRLGLDIRQWQSFEADGEVPRVLFLGICLDFHYFSTGVVFPKFGFDFSWGAVAQALVEP